MAITINKTISDPNANSYCDVNYADDYFLAHYDSVKAAAWDNLGDDQKTQALVQATRILETARFTNPVTLDQYAMYYERRTGLILQLDLTREPVKLMWTQRLQFPRNLDRDWNANGNSYIPESILMAQCEQAIYLVSYDETAVSNRLKGVVNDTVGIGNAIHLNQEYGATGSAFAPMALEYCRTFFLSTGSRHRRG